MTIKALATADLHLGQASSQVPSSDRHTATKHTWLNLVDYAIQGQIDLIVIAGDLVDQDNKYFEAIGPLEEGFKKLGENNIPVYMVAGNHDHDVLNDVAKSTDQTNVTLLGARGAWETQVVNKGDEQLQLLGWSFPQKHVNYDPASAGYFNSDLDPELPTLGLVHGDLFDEKSRYAPLNKDNLSQANVNGWIVGHIHKPQTIQDNRPFIQYPGSPHAMDPGEDGVHGILSLGVEQNGTISVDQEPFSPVCYLKADVEVTGSEDESTFRDLITSKLTDKATATQYEGLTNLIFDINLTGYHTRIHELDNWTNQLGDYRFNAGDKTDVSIRKVTNAAKPKIEDLEKAAMHDRTAKGKLASLLLAIENGESNEFLDQLLPEWREKVDKLSKKPIYQPIQADANEDHAKQLIYEECNKLLSELLLQENNDNSNE